jgi:hypothetical protein
MSLDRDRDSNPAATATASAPARDTVRCPTCRTVQVWSDTCRRCKSDLRLLRAVAAAYQRNRRHCLERLRSGSAQAALPAARRCHSLNPDPESRRLLALASLQAGDWATAGSLASRIVQEE